MGILSLVAGVGWTIAFTITATAAVVLSADAGIASVQLFGPAPSVRTVAVVGAIALFVLYGSRQLLVPCEG